MKTNPPMTVSKKETTASLRGTPHLYYEMLAQEMINY